MTQFLRLCAHCRKIEEVKRPCLLLTGIQDDFLAS